MKRTRIEQLFTFNYGTIDQATGLFVAAKIYDVTTGIAVFVTTVGMTYDLVLGCYSGNWTGVFGRTYLIKKAVYTTSGYSIIVTTRAIDTEEFGNSDTFYAFDYTEIGQTTGLTVNGTVYDVTGPSPVAIKTIPMVHIANGVYFGVFTGLVGKCYQIVSGVYANGSPNLFYAPVAEEFQCSSLFAISTNSGLDPIDAALEGLCNFLSTNIPALTVINEWPYGNQQLKYPSLTASTMKPKRTPEMPYQVGQSATDGNGQTVVNEVVANYDTTFQLDLWTRNKAERKQYVDQIISLFNAQEIDSSWQNKADGLSLQLTNYYNEWCRYEIDTRECVDDEAAAQRQERRERIMVLVNIREIRQRTYYAISSVQVESQVVDEKTFEVFTDDAANTESNNI